MLIDGSWFSQLIYANQEKKRVAHRLPGHSPLDCMLFQVKKGKRLLAVWVKVSLLLIPYPV